MIRGLVEERERMKNKQMETLAPLLAWFFTWWRIYFPFLCFLFVI